MIFLGFDIGGSKSLCVVATKDAVLGRMKGEGSNLHQEGLAQTTQRILGLVHESLDIASLRGMSVHAAVCLAGLDTEGSRQALWNALHEAEPAVIWRVENDAVGAWRGAFTTGRVGVVAIAGTGAAAYARDDECEARAGGWGAVLGDDGSGYNLGRSALIAVLQAQDGMGPPTSLTQAVLSELDIPRTQDIIDLVHFRMKPSDIAALAPRVLAEAVCGDAKACHIVDEAATALVRTAAAAARGARPVCSAMPFALVGGMSNNDHYRQRVRLMAERFAPVLTWHEPDASPDLGAVYLAMESAAIHWHDFAHLLQTGASLRG